MMPKKVLKKGLPLDKRLQSFGVNNNKFHSTILRYEVHYASVLKGAVSNATFRTKFHYRTWRHSFFVPYAYYSQILSICTNDLTFFFRCW